MFFRKPLSSPAIRHCAARQASSAAGSQDANLGAAKVKLVARLTADHAHAQFLRLLQQSLSSREPSAISQPQLARPEVGQYGRRSAHVVGMRRG